MTRKLNLILLFFFSFNLAFTQDPYKIIKLNINKDVADFSPYIWNDNLVFSSERPSKAFGAVYIDKNTGTSKISLFKSKILSDTSFSSSEVFSKDIQSNHHVGPASFTSDGKKIYFSQPYENRESRKNDDNKLGIFEADWNGSEWISIKMLPFNDVEYNLSHPAISPNGDFIVFASDKDPGSPGKAELFVSRKNGSKWSDPVPLSREINSKKADKYPYIHYNGDLYFASDRKGDFDIYRCKVRGDSWEPPVKLPEPVNSKYDDYSIYLDNTGRYGYFASDREGLFDLYYFEKPAGEDVECDSLIDETFCYSFPPIDSKELEGLPLVFEWYINGEVAIPEEPYLYCFPEAGRYSVKLNIVDTASNQVIFIKEQYEFLVGRVEQPYIQLPDDVRVNEVVDFNATGTYLPSITMEEFVWDFGDGSGDNGVEVEHEYTTIGNYRVSLTIFGSPSDGVIPQFCSYKYINVSDDAALVDGNVTFKDPLDLKAFIRLIEYEPLPDDLYYLNLMGSSDHVMMINIHNADEYLALSDPLFKDISDTTKIHVFANADQSYSYYYGATFNLKDAYQNLVECRGAGFANATIKKFKYTKLQSDEYFLNPMEDVSDLFAVVLKRSQTPIENFKKVFKKVPKELGEVRELYVEDEGYYYVVGNSEELNESFSTYSELKFAGFNSIRIKDFKEKNMFALYDDLSPSQTTSAFMVELFTADNYISASDSIFDSVEDRKLVSLRLKKRKVGYYVEGGSNLIEAKATLLEMKKRGFENARISSFEYEKLNDDGFYITKLDDGTFSYIITFDSTDTPKSKDADFGNALLGYKVYEKYDKETKKYYYQVDAGQNLPEAVLLAKGLLKDSQYYQQISKLRYDPLNDDEFYLDPLEDGDEQYVLVLGSFKEKQNVYKAFKGFSSCSNIREFYDAVNKKYVYIAGGYESLEEVFVEMEKCNDNGMEGMYIQRFVYDPLDPDQFYLQTVNEEEEIYRITLNRSGEDAASDKSTDEKYDNIRDEGDVIDSYDQETKEFVVALGKSKSLPKALSYLGTAIENGYNSVKIQRYIYSSMDQDRFVIRDLDKEDRFMCVELFLTDSLLTPDDPILRELSRKYPIAYSYNETTKDFVYVMGPLENVEGALEFLELAKSEGFNDARIMSMVFRTLENDEFYLEEIKDEEMEFVLTILQTKNRVDTNDIYFDGLPEGVRISELKDNRTGYYNYMIRSYESIDDADSLFSVLVAQGYPNVRLELLKYDKLSPDDFSLETISELSEDYTISILRSKEKLGTDNPIFEAINKEANVYEYYNYKTKEFIYALGKVNTMIDAFKMMEIANKYGFSNATLDRFVYSTLNPDHFSLETIDENAPIFTIVIESGNKKYDDEHFQKLVDKGFEVREKYIPTKDKWVYSIGLTENIAEANRIAEMAKKLGYENAEISRFNYMPLNEDKYYLTEMEDIETAFMLELAASEKPIDLKSEEFDNVNGVYKVSEVYDPIDKMFKYYAGKAIYDEEYAEDFQKELIAMGYVDVRISKFVYNSLKVDEYYLETIEIDDTPFLINDKNNFELFVYFGFDQYFLTSKAIEKLKGFFELHYDVNYQILLEGYTDSIGDANYNIWLSKKRALSVKKYLLKMGVPESNISLIAKGESEPIFSKPNVEDYRKSRRVLLRSYRKGE